jgi:hypothetical protein
VDEEQEGNPRGRLPPEAGALDHVVDDLPARLECEEWVYAELASGRTPEDISGDLVAGGWPRDDAESIVEEARRQTRHERGVVSREDIVREANQRYHRGMGAGLLTGLPTAISAKRLFYSILNVLALGRLRKRGK